jgi:DNA-binding MarR family transcriptional regulator
VADEPALGQGVVDVLAALVASGGEATAPQLAESCGLTKPQLTRQLDWMERKSLINQVHSRNGRTRVRATIEGRAALSAAEASEEPSG